MSDKIEQIVTKAGNSELNHKECTFSNTILKQKLTVKEFRLLQMFFETPNKVLERESLLKGIWGNNDYFAGRSMDVYITKIRKYLKSDLSLKLSNCHGVGFMLEVSVL